METKVEIVIEELDSAQIPFSELSEFTETQPIKIEEIESEDQEILIKKYVNGEVSFPSYFTTLDDEEDDIEDVDDDDDDDDGNNDNNDGNTSLEAENITAKQSIQVSTSKMTILDNDNQHNKKNKRQGGIGVTGGTGRRRTILSPTLQGLMGEANLNFARGQNEITEKICLEIIRQNPWAPEPFYTLAQIYETKDIEKFLNFSTLAAHLDPSNRDQWIRIAELNIENKNYGQARVLYSKAIKYMPKDYDLRLKKAKVLELMGEHRDAMFSYLRMIPLVPEDKSELCLVTAKNVATYFHEQNKLQLALEAMRGAYHVVPSLFTKDDLNLFLELLIANKCYNIVLKVLVEQTKLDLIMEQDDDNDIIVITCSIPDHLIPEFRVKICVSLIHCKAYHLIDYLIDNFLQIIPIVGGIEWYMDFAEALMTEHKYAETLKLLKPIVDNDLTPPAYVWLRHAECYRAMGSIENAIKSYYAVVSLAPFCYDAKFTLSALLKQQGRYREAIKALEQDMEGDSINPRLLYERCLMLKTIGEDEQYIDIGYLLLSRKSLKFRSREEMIACSHGGNNFNPDTYKSIVETRFDKDDDQPEYNELESNLCIDDEYELFKDIAKMTFKLKKFGILQKLCFAMATSKRFRSKSREIEKIIMLASLYNDDPLIAFYFFREILPKNLNNNAYWNFMSVLIQPGDEIRYHRFLKRIFERHSCSSYLKILLANYHLIAGSYKYALNTYSPIFKESNDSFSALCIGICFTQISLQKNSLRKTTGIAQAIAFIKKYSELRMSSETEQEIYYNLGRMYHQSGVIHIALNYYEKALNIHNEIINENLEILGLQEEIAYNIHLIYKSVGNFEMARKYLYKYVIV